MSLYLKCDYGRTGDAEFLGHQLELLRSGDYSDIIIRCRQTTFNVHKAILCPAAAFFKKACSYRWTEGEAGVIELHDEDPDLLALLLISIYAGNCHSISGTTSGPDKWLPPNDSQHEGEIIHEIMRDADPSYGRSKMSDLNIFIFCVCHRLLLNAKRYQIADKYGATVVKRLAQDEYESALDLMTNPYMEDETELQGVDEEKRCNRGTMHTTRQEHQGETAAGDFLASMLYMNRFLPNAADSDIWHVALAHARECPQIWQDQERLAELCKEYPDLAWELVKGRKRTWDGEAEY